MGLFFGYFIGSIPFGLLLTKYFGYGDIRAIGSGNIGATNVLRTGNKKLALLTLILDGAKGAVIVLIMKFLHPYNPVQNTVPPEMYSATSVMIGFMAVLGHCFPIWLNFKGGKGVATSLGVLLAAVPFAGLAACATWLLSAKLTKISSLSALLALLIAPFATYAFYGLPPAIICTFVTLVIWLRHAQNIKRILNGTEPKIGANKNSEAKIEPVSK